jgi:hypothetical protein
VRALIESKKKIEEQSEIPGVVLNNPSKHPIAGSLKELNQRSEKSVLYLETISPNAPRMEPLM